MFTDHLDCELYLSDFDQALVEIRGRQYPGRPRLDETLFERLRVVERTEDPKSYGSHLFQALFPAGDELRRGYDEGRGAGESPNLRLRLHIPKNAPAKLHDLHWELLYDPTGAGRALGRSSMTPFSRYLSVDRSAPPMVETRPARVLVVVSCPADAAAYGLPVLARDEVTESVTAALAPLGKQGDVEWEVLEGAATPGRIRDRLLETEPHVLHLCAHGRVDPDRGASLVLETEAGDARFMGEEDFAEIFGGVTSLRLVTLIACHGGKKSGLDPSSGLGPRLVQQGIPAVVAMRREIGVETAAGFTRHFYRHLSRTGQVDLAANEARLQLYIKDPRSYDWGTPALFLRLADGRLWNVPPSTSPRRSSSPPPPGDIDWDLLVHRLEKKDVVPVLGPGTSDGLLPLPDEIAHRWAQEHQCPQSRFTTTSLPSLARYVKITKDSSFLHEKLSGVLIESLLDHVKPGERGQGRGRLSAVIEEHRQRIFELEASAPYLQLAGFGLPNYLTTNYDSLLYEALRWHRRSPLRESCRWRSENADGYAPADERDLEGSETSPLVFHLFGHDGEPGQCVLTEDDFLDYLIAANPGERLPRKLHQAVTESMLLFLGYRVTNLDWAVLFRGLLNQLRHGSQGSKKRVAVLQLDPADRDSSLDLVRDFVSRWCKELDVQVSWLSVREFLQELEDRFAAAREGPEGSGR